QATQANKRRQPSHSYKAGDQVLLSAENLPTQYRASKLSSKWIGPFPITQYLPWRQTAILDLTEEPELSNISNSFNTSLIKPLTPNLDDKFPSRAITKPGPVKEDRYEVEELLEYRIQPGTDIPQYLVKWEGWGINQSTWEKADQVDESLKRRF